MSYLAAEHDLNRVLSQTRVTRQQEPSTRLLLSQKTLAAYHDLKGGININLKAYLVIGFNFDSCCEVNNFELYTAT
jgi:hypothetical protein